MKSRYLYSLIFFVFQVFAEEEVIFLDYAASYPINEDVLKEFMEVSRINGNSSGINPRAHALKGIEDKSAKVIANKIGADSEQIHFTASATMANNMAILGAANKYPGCHLITSKIEHKSVLNVFKQLEKDGYKVTYLDVNSSGKVDLDQLRRSITSDTKLISIQMLNSEIGVRQDIVEIGKIAHEHGVLFHCDAAQAFCRYEINVKCINVDLLTISGHKIGAPKGIAALYVKDKSKLQPIMFGSGDELFPGTKPTPLIAAFASAVKHFKFDKQRIDENYKTLEREVSKIDGVHINSTYSGHIFSFSIEGVLLGDILERMKTYSFSAGCSCTGEEKSDVMQAIDPENKLPPCTIRVSFSDEINPEILIKFCCKLKETVKELRKDKRIDKGCSTGIKNTSNVILTGNVDKIRELIKSVGNIEKSDVL